MKKYLLALGLFICVQNSQMLEGVRASGDNNVPPSSVMSEPTENDFQKSHNEFKAAFENFYSGTIVFVLNFLNEPKVDKAKNPGKNPENLWVKYNDLKAHIENLTKTSENAINSITHKGNLNLDPKKVLEIISAYDAYKTLAQEQFIEYNRKFNDLAGLPQRLEDAKAPLKEVVDKYSGGYKLNLGKEVSQKAKTVQDKLDSIINTVNEKLLPSDKSTQVISRLGSIEKSLDDATKDIPEIRHIIAYNDLKSAIDFFNEANAQISKTNQFANDVIMGKKRGLDHSALYKKAIDLITTNFSGAINNYAEFFSHISIDKNTHQEIKSLALEFVKGINQKGEELRKQDQGTKAISTLQRKAKDKAQTVKDLKTLEITFPDPGKPHQNVHEFALENKEKIKEACAKETSNKENKESCARLLAIFNKDLLNDIRNNKIVLKTPVAGTEAGTEATAVLPPPPVAAGTEATAVLQPPVVAATPSIEELKAAAKTAEEKVTAAEKAVSRKQKDSNNYKKAAEKLKTATTEKEKADEALKAAEAAANSTK